VAILSTKRLDPNFWGEAANAQDATEQRLVGLMLHTIGQLLSLPPHPSSQNIMFPYEELDQLRHMRDLTAEQARRMARGVPAESRDLVAEPSARAFVIRRVCANMGSIWRTIMRSNPFRLAYEMTTMIAAAFSLIVVIFFSPEMWDIGSTVEFYQFAIFSLIAVSIAALVVYRAYPLRTVVTHTTPVRIAGGDECRDPGGLVPDDAGALCALLGAGLRRHHHLLPTPADGNLADG